MSKIVFFATPKIALKSFEALIKDPDFEVLGLVTQAPKPSGRGKKIVENELKTYAKAHNIKVIEPEKISHEPDIIEALRNLKPDFFVTFAFGQILSQEILDIPSCGTINLHASLLPKYRGANPIREVLLGGEEKTGVTTMLTVLELDAGDICIQEEIPIDKNMNSIRLSEKISEISPDIIKKTLLGLKCGKTMPCAQNHTCATFTKKTKKQDKIINWNESAELIHNKVRAMVDNFTCQTTFGGKIVKIIKTTVSDKKGEPGVVLDVNKNGIIVGTLDGSVNLEIVKPEGKGEMSAYNWSLGARIKTGDRFES